MIARTVERCQLEETRCGLNERSDVTLFSLVLLAASASGSGDRLAVGCT
jgi:hypothetical protein